MTIKDTNVTINVSDMDRSIAFYQAIGFQLHQRWENHYAQLSAPGLTIGLHPSSSVQLKGGSGNVSIGFTTDDLVKAKTALTALSIPMEERTEAGGHFLHFADPDGTALYFIAPKW